MAGYNKLKVNFVVYCKPLRLNVGARSNL